MWPLLLFAVAVSVGAPRLLGRARWTCQSPRLGIAAWYATLTAVLSAVGITVAVSVLPLSGGSAPVCMAWQWCVQAARGRYGVLGLLVTAAVAAAAILLAGRLVGCGVRFTREHRARRRQHLQLLSLIGQETAELGATVVQSAQPAAYMVAGPGRRIVVTSAAVAALGPDELAAVLAHERAHAAGRHDVILGGIGLLRMAFPWSALFRTAAQQLGRLVEMRADEVAVTEHRPIVLARALVALAGAPPVIPASAIGATGGDAMARLDRLLDPPARLGTVRKTCIAAVLGLTGMAPTAGLAAVWAFPTLHACLLSAS
ncbi:M56 family metallopeptidase [Actinoplanes campanulatus]|uniref:M56 family metallopeptidase n=1 Tax=Actinoplanes campanulatus TaxID=113559 RepID=UPI001954E440|nr:M56 family metallopeptidase [Actinoplanes capillaceus]